MHSLNLVDSPALSFALWSSLLVSSFGPLTAWQASCLNLKRLSLLLGASSSCTCGTCRFHRGCSGYWHSRSTGPFLFVIFCNSSSRYRWESTLSYRIILARHHPLAFDLLLCIIYFDNMKWMSQRLVAEPLLSWCILPFIRKLLDLRACASTFPSAQPPWRSWARVSSSPFDWASQELSFEASLRHQRRKETPGQDHWPLIREEDMESEFQGFAFA